MSAALQVVVMGVSGTGKSAVGTRLAARLDMEHIEGDAFHPQANIDKMSDGVALTDEDRRPWLETLAHMLKDNRERAVSTVLGCSALRRSYRDILRGPEADGALLFVHLSTSFEVLRDRMEHREHFMPPSLLQTQVDTLEPLQEDESGFQLDVDAPLADVVDAAVDGLRNRLG